MWATIGAILQIILVVLQNKFQKDAEERKRKDDLHQGWAEIVKSGDTVRINDFLSKLRA